MSVKFLETRLENGLTIIGELQPEAMSSAVGFFVKTGARDETEIESGVSHFLEHMMFKGTKKRSAIEINFAFGNVGAQANAFTSEENTVYYAALLPEYIPDAIDVLADMLRPVLDPTEFNVEKKVILEEIALYQDRPVHVLFEKSLKTHFGEYPTGNSVLGSIASITALTRDQMKTYFDRRYSPANIVFAVSGMFDWEAVVTQIKELCGAWTGPEARRNLLPFVASEKNSVIKRQKLQHSHACLIAGGPTATDDARYESAVLSCILGDTSGSKLYWKLIDTGIADSATIDTDEMDGTGIVYGYVSTLPEQLDQAVEILREVFLKAADFSEDELERAKTKIATRLVLQGESPMRRLMALGLGWNARKGYQPLQSDVDRVMQVSRQSIAATLEKFPFTPTTCIKMIPA